jgi:hypothetical protein
LREDQYGAVDVSDANKPTWDLLKISLQGFLEDDPLRWLDESDHVVRRVEE